MDNNLFQHISQLNKEPLSSHSYKKNWILYLPSEKRYGCLMVQSYEYRDILKKAPLLVKSILDESLPVNVQKWDVVWEWILYWAGRYANAQLLWDVRYFPAIPNLIECACDDLNPDMKIACLCSIGNMGKYAYKYAQQIQNILLNDTNTYIRQESARILWMIWNPSSLQILKKIVEDTIYEFENFIILEFKEEEEKKIRNNSIIINPNGEKKFEEYWKRFLFQKSLRAIFELDNNLWRKIYQRCQESISEYIRESSKRTFIGFM